VEFIADASKDLTHENLFFIDDEHTAAGGDP